MEEGNAPTLERKEAQMQAILPILEFIQSILTKPAWIMGLFAFVGLVALKRPAHKVMTGTLKPILGYIMLSAGAAVVQENLAPLGTFIETGFHITGVVPNNEVVVSMAQSVLGVQTMMILILGYVVNIIIARFTKFKYIFLTGQAMLYVSCLTAVILVSAGFGNGLFTILLGGLFEGTLLTVTPALCQPFMRVITGGDTVAMGHTGNIGYALAGWCGKWFGNKEHSTEDINVPKSMSFLRDSTVSITIVMAIVYVILALMTGQQFVEENLSKGTNYIIYAIVQAGTFAAGFAVVLQGVRMILAEIVPAFQGIAMKLVPNSKPALDVPIIFPYAPNAVLLGFFVSFIVGTLSMFGMVALGTVVIIPGVVGHFFCGAAAAIYGNAKGGRRGAIIGAAVNSLLISWLPLFILPVLGNLSLASSTFADTDYLIPGIILGNIGALGETALLVGIIGFTILVCLASKLMKEPEKA